MKDKDIKISREEYLAELATMMCEAFSEACNNNEEQQMLVREAILLITDPDFPKKLEQPVPLELYKERQPRAELANRKENPYEFLYRVYADQLGKGLVRPDIKHMDKSLYAALYKYRHHRDIVPTDIDEKLPKKSGKKTDANSGSALKYKKRKQILERQRNKKFYYASSPA
jgi:hypothetical protein